MNELKQTFPYGKHTVVISTGHVARQATAAVMVDMDGTTVLVTVVGVKTADASRDFFPLTVNYQERTYAAGSIPGGYFKREGRPTEKETLTSRLIDRPIRPLFPEGFNNEVQIVATVMSFNPEVNPDIPAMIGASAALALSGMPFQGPIGAARVGYINNQYVLNPTYTELNESALDLVVAGTKDAVLMVESEAAGLSEAVMLGAVVFGHQASAAAIDAILALKAQAGKPDWGWKAPVTDDALQLALESLVGEGLRQAYHIQEKQQRYTAIDVLRDKAIEQLASSQENDGKAPMSQVIAAFSRLESHIVRGRILAGEARIDGRDLQTIRPIHVQPSFLPRVHGSAKFTRGETQAIVVATLGSGKDAQLIDALEGERKDAFMLHYNFPPYCVGEVGQVGSPKRREIGHGNLAKRAIKAVLPHTDDFPYVLRVVSEITESNGSSSMASVCGTSLALMDAGVPIKDAVAGIAMGLVKEAHSFAVISDILGDEDHLGDMDFKVAGTKDGVTALQMDIKITGITPEIMQIALEQARVGRLHILGIMNQALAAPRQELSDYAPRITSFTINPEKIRDVIGKGGATIRGIIESTGVTIDVTDDGVVKIASADGVAAAKAKEMIDQIVADVVVGQIYEGKVTKIVDFGAFVAILPGKEGLLHISQIANERIENVSDKLQEGQMVRVKVLEIDKQGRIRLSARALLEEPTE